MKINLFTLFIIVLSVSKTSAQHTEVINSNRPGESMSAFAVGKTVIQVESGLSYVKEKHSGLDYKASGFTGDFNVRYGFFKEQLETILELNYQNDTYTNDAFIDTNRKGLKSSTLGLKYLVYDPFKNYKEKIDLLSWKASHKFKWRQLIPAISLYAGANLNFSPNPFLFGGEKISRINPKGMLITQQIFPGALVFITNIFIDKVGTNNQTLGYIATLTKGFNEKWSAYIENKGLKGDYYGDGFFSAGAAFLANDNLQFDAFVSKNFKTTPDFLYAGFGLSWRSTTNYNDVMIRIPKGAKNKDKSKKEKEKVKEKKRLDEVQVEKP
jgi:hypothetical protein